MESCRYIFVSVPVKAVLLNGFAVFSVYVLVWVVEQGTLKSVVCVP